MSLPYHHIRFLIYSGFNIFALRSHIRGIHISKSHEIFITTLNYLSFILFPPLTAEHSANLEKKG